MIPNVPDKSSSSTGGSGSHDPPCRRRTYSRMKSLAAGRMREECATSRSKSPVPPFRSALPQPRGQRLPRPAVQAPHVFTNEIIGRRPDEGGVRHQPLEVAGPALLLELAHG